MSTDTTDREGMTADECATTGCPNGVETDDAWCLDCRKFIVRAGQEIVGGHR